jgi:hypothetical protein
LAEFRTAPAFIFRHDWRRIRQKGGIMKVFIGWSMGLLSGLVIYLMGSFAFLDLRTPVDTRIAGGAFLLFGGWIVSAFFLLRGAMSTTQVLSRGFLLGAAEWLLMIGVGFVRAGRMLDLTGIQTERSVVSGGIVASVLGGFSLFMIAICLAGFAVVQFWKRQKSPPVQPLL